MSDIMFCYQRRKLTLEFLALTRKDFPRCSVPAKDTLQKNPAVSLEDFEGKGMSSTHFVKCSMHTRTYRFLALVNPIGLAKSTPQR